MIDSTLSGTSADIGHHRGVGYGGGIFSFGTLTVNSCILADNSASNDGGGIVNWQASLTVIDRSLKNNSAVGEGGGIYSLRVSVPVCGIGATIRRSTLSPAGNTASLNLVGKGIVSIRTNGIVG